MRDILFAQPIVTDLERQLGCEDLFTWVEGEANRLSSIDTGHATHVRLTRRFFRERNIVCVERDTSLDQHATIRHTVDGYVIRLLRGLPPNRARFVLAHEIGHTYFMNADGSPISNMQLQHPETVESLCNFFARSLLLPRKRLASRLRDLGWHTLCMPALHMIQSLATDFRVAEEAVARRLVFDFATNLESVVCITDYSNATNLADWRVNWCATEANYRSRMPSGWRIPLRSSRRKIPADMVPSVSTCQTVALEVDGRWHDSVRPKPESESKRWLSRQAPRPARPALFASVIMEEQLFGSSRKRCFLAM